MRLVLVDQYGNPMAPGFVVNPTFAMPVLALLTTTVEGEPVLLLRQAPDVPGEYITPLLQQATAQAPSV